MRTLRRPRRRGRLRDAARRGRARARRPGAPRRRRSAGCTAGPACPGFVRRSCGPGWALVGDAGYFKDPITTHGMTDALRDAELLADAVLEVLAGARAGGGRRWRRYQATRDRLSSRPVRRRPRRSRRYDWDARPGRGAAARGQLGDERRGRAPPGAAGPSCGDRSPDRRATDTPATPASVSAAPEGEPADECRHQAARGLRGRRRRRPGPADAWARRQPPRWSRCSPLAPGRRLHREQVIDALWPDLPAGRGRAAAAQGRALRPPRARRRRAAPWCCATTLVALLPGADVQSSTSTSSAPGARRAGRGVRRSAAAGALERVRRAAAARRPLRAVEPGAPRDALRLLHLDLLRLAGRWEELLRGGPRRRAGPPGADRGPAPTGATSAAALRQFERLEQALRRELGTAPSPEAERAARAGWRRGRRTVARGRATAARRLVGRREVGDQLRGRLDAGRGGPGRHPARHRTSRASASRRCSSWPTPLARAARLAHRARARRRRSRGRGRTRRCSRRSATCAASTPRCSTGWTTTTAPRSNGPCPGGTSTWSGESGHQRLFVAAAELMRLAAAGHGAAARRRRRPRGRRGLVAAAALPVALRGERAGAARAGAPPGHRRRPGEVVRQPGGPRGRQPARAARRWTAAATRRLLADRFPDARRRRRAERIVEVSGGLPFPCSSWRRAGQRAAAGVPARPARPVLRTFQRVALLGIDVHHRRAAGRVRGDARTRPTGTSTTALAALVVEPADGGLPVPARAGARGADRQRCPRRSRRDRRGVRSPSSSPRSGAAPARVAHQLSPPGSPRAPCRTWSGRSRRPARSAPTATRWPWSTRSAPHAGPTDLPRAAGPARRPAARARRPGGGCRLPGGGAASPPAPSTGWCAPGWPAPRLRGRPRHRAQRTGRARPRGRRRRRPDPAGPRATSPTSPATSRPPGEAVGEAREPAADHRTTRGTSSTSWRCRA